MSAVDVIKQSKIGMYPPNCTELGNTVLELEERVKALEDLVQRHIRLHIKEELAEPAPAPDLLEASTALMEYLQSPQCTVENFDIPDDIYGPFVDAVKKGGRAPAPDLDDQIGICVARLLASDPVDWYDVLRAFAAELGFPCCDHPGKDRCMQCQELEPKP